MSLSIRERVVKSCTVQVTGPLLVQPFNAGIAQGSNIIPEAAELRDAVDAPAPLEDPLKFTAVEADKILAQTRAEARTEAQEIIAQAQNEAAEIKRLAQTQVEQWKEEAALRVREEKLAEAQAEARQTILRAERILTSVQRTMEQKVAEAEGELVSLAIKIAERFIRTSLSFEPERLLDIVKQMVLMPQNQKGFRLRISTRDANFISQLHKDSLPCPWAEDGSLAQGEICLEHAQGILNFQVESQLAKLEQILMEELMRGSMEPVAKESRSV